jgi:hypothetical protein
MITMGEANRTFLATLSDNDGLEYNTYTRAELDARRAEFKAARASQTPDAVYSRARRAKLKASDPDYLNKERLRLKLIRANNPGMTRASFKKWEDKYPDWVDNYKENRKGLARKGEFIPIDSEGQNYPYSDISERDIIYKGVPYAPHATYLWGAYSDRTKKPLYLTDPRSKAKVKYKLTAKVIFDWLLNDVKEAYGDANYVMFGMSYDMTQLLLQLPHNVTYEIFKGKRFDDEHEFDAPVFWGEYAIKLVQSKWLILWRLRDHNKPYKLDSEGAYILDKKGRMQLDAVQKIKIYETFGYFQTGFAKVVEDMMKEQKSTASKQLLELAKQAEHVNSIEFETAQRLQIEKRANLPLGDGVWGLGSYINEDGTSTPYTMEQLIKGARTYEMTVIEKQRGEVKVELDSLSKDAALIKEFKPLRGDFKSKEIEPIREYMTGELRQLAVRMEQIRQTLEKLELFPTSWHGPGAVASALITKYKIRDHFGEDISTDVTPGSPQDYAHHAFSGGRIEATQQGYEKAGYLAAYDVSSAYPAGAVELPSLAPHTGQWVFKTKEELQFKSLEDLRELIEKTSMVSMFKVKWHFPTFHKPGIMGKHYANIYKDPTSVNVPFYPLWYRTESGRILCPSSGYGIRNREDVLAAIAWMEYYMPNYPKGDYYTGTPNASELAFFEIEDAQIWEIKEGYEDERPFEILKWLYGKRRSIKNDIEAKNKEMDKLNAAVKERNIIALAEGKDLEPEIPYEYDITEKVLKLILNSVYGKLAQFVGSFNKVPNCANPYYAAAITAYCRRRLIELAMVDPSAIVFFATDGIMATRPLHHLPNPVKGVKNCSIKRSGKRVRDESAGEVISLGDWEYAQRDGGIFTMAGVYVHYMVERDDRGAFLFDANGNPKSNAKYTGRLRGADITKYADGNDGQPWLVSNTLKAWREPFDIDDKETYPAIVSAYQKFITVGSVLTPRYSPMLRDGQLVENNRHAIEQRYGRAGRWSPRADDPDNEKIKLMNRDIRAWNEDVKSRTKAKIKWKYDGALKLGLIEELPEIVCKRTIHVHDAGLKRTHNLARHFDYSWQGDNPPSRTTGLIETIPAGNLKRDSEGRNVLNWAMSAPRMPEWLNKADEAAADDMELDGEIKAGIFGFDDDGDNEHTVDIYADT